MSDTRHQRFEIDLDEIERQLRRSVETPPPARDAQPGGAKADPLSELARIVGQDDPFRDILGDGKPGAPPAAQARPEPSFGGPTLTSEESAVLRGDRAPPPATGQDAPFDPIADAYGSPENAIDAEDLQPLRPRRSRRRLTAVMAVLAVGAAGVTGALLWRNTGGSFSASGPPPVIRADTAPLKVAPENPGGIDIPDQNKQIYERGPQEGRTRIVDRQEQPIDVREATRSMPSGDVRLPPPPVPAPVEVATPGASAPPPASASGAPSATAPRPAANSVTSALGEPRRVRTVAVRPDGTSIGGPSLSGSPEAAPTYIPNASALPPPVSVPTIAVLPNGSPARPTPPDPAAAAAITPTLGGATPTATPVTVLPPQRPRTAATPAPALAEPNVEAPADGSAGPEVVPNQPPVRILPPRRPVAALQTPAAPEAVPADPGSQAAPAAAGRTYSVQIASRASEDEARASYAQLSERYSAALDGQPAAIATAEVNGRTVYRVRVGPLSREAANSLCTRLKSSGGACAVIAN
jgi:hypothetical protein